MSYLSVAEPFVNPSPWDKIVDLRHAVEDSQRQLVEQLIDDRHVLESKVRILERRLRETEGSSD